MPSVHNMEYDLDCWRVKVKNSMKTMVKNTEWRNWEKGELRQMNTNIITQKTQNWEQNVLEKSYLEHHKWLQFHHLDIK